MKKRFLCLLTLVATLMLCPQNRSFAQEAQQDVKEKAIEKKPDENKNGDEEEKPSEMMTDQEIRSLIRSRQLEEAAEKLEAAITASPNDGDLRDLQDTLAKSCMMSRKYDESYKQLRQSFEYRIANADDARNQARLAMTVSLLRMAALRKGEKQVAEDAIDQAVKAIENCDLGAVSILALSTLLPQKARQMASDGDVPGANEMLVQRIERIDNVDASGRMKEALLIAKSRLLFAVATLPKADEQAKTDLDEFIVGAIDQFPESRAILFEYSRVQMMLISGIYREDPENARDRMNRSVEVLEKATENNKSLRSYLPRIKSFESRIDSALRLKQMIGQPAPEMEVAAWVNQGDLAQDSLAGKVVLLDFWSVWCGPCIATFPHLREWYDEYHDRGFEIVGVTRFYNYTWDDDAKRAKKSKGKVEADDELVMLEQFLNHHELRHPTIVTPEGSEMQKAYGVTGIPHAVLIDRKGNIQMVKVGSGSRNADALHAKIEDLIAE